MKVGEIIHMAMLHRILLEASVHVARSIKSGHHPPPSSFTMQASVDGNGPETTQAAMSVSLPVIDLDLMLTRGENDEEVMRECRKARKM